MDSKMQEAFEKWKESHVWLRHSTVGNFSEIAVMREAFEAGAALVRAEVAERLRELFVEHRFREHKQPMIGGYCTCGLFGQTRGQSHDSWAKHVLEILLAPSSERGTMEWTACSCDPEYAHHCVFCGGTGRINRVLKLDERGRETP
jgi:hypothetical protein